MTQRADTLRAWKQASREQRDAYLEWLLEPLGPGWMPTLQAYFDASARLRAAEAKMDEAWCQPE